MECNDAWQLSIVGVTGNEFLRLLFLTYNEKYHPPISYKQDAKLATKILAAFAEAGETRVGSCSLLITLHSLLQVSAAYTYSINTDSCT